MYLFKLKDSNRYPKAVIPLIISQDQARQEAIKNRTKQVSAKSYSVPQPSLYGCVFFWLFFDDFLHGLFKINLFFG
jgi:hypothetical protein